MVYQMEAKDTAKHPAMQGQTPTAKNYLAANVSSAEIEKTCPELGSGIDTNYIPKFHKNNQTQ